MPRVLLPLIGPFLGPLAGFFVFFGILLLLLGSAGKRRPDSIEDRMRQATRRPSSIDEIEMQAPFVERFVRPFLAALARGLARFTPSSVLDGTQQRLVQAGLQGQMQTSDFIGMRSLTTLAGIGVAILFTFLLHQGPIIGIALLVVFGGLGYFGPILWLRNKTAKRRTAITNALPDVIDLLTISVEAGLGFDQALQRVVSKSENLLTLEFSAVLRQMQLGVTRRDSLRQLVERTGVDDLSAFVGAIIQAEQLGASVGRVLRIQSVEMRVRRRQRAQTLAQQAPIKILFPMAFLIFPPVFIVVLGPAIPRIIKAFDPSAPL